MMKTVAIIQARMSSSRLPGKIMTDIAGKPMLQHVINRVQKARMLDLVLVATSENEEDDVVARFCHETGISCFRGSLDDVLDRYYQAAKYVKASVIVRITADCPLLDPHVIDKVVMIFSKGNFDYVSNIIECTYPDGLDTEVFSLRALEYAWQKAKLKSEREHVTPYIRKHPEIFRMANVSHTENVSSMRWTVDEPQDLDFIRIVFKHIGNSDFCMEEVLNLLKQHPEICIKNANIKRNEGYLKSLREDSMVEDKGVM